MTSVWRTVMSEGLCGVEVVGKVEARWSAPFEGSQSWSRKRTSVDWQIVSASESRQSVGAEP